MSVNLTTRNKCTVISSFNDWSLPSKDELTAMYTELHLYGLGSFSINTNGYFSSTEDSSLPIWTCWAQRFDTGAGVQSSKNSYRYVRACRTFISSIVYSLRNTGQAGGLIFHIIDNGDSTYTYYETAPGDQSTNQLWTNPPQDNIAIGVSAQGTAIGTGQTNTNAIIGQSGHTGSAAKLCDDLVVYF